MIETGETRGFGMKKYFVVMIIALVGTVALGTNQIEVGTSVIFPSGGDVENGDIGFGIQGVMPLNETFDMELSISKFGDSLGITEMSLTQFGATLRWNHSISDLSKFYVGAGLNFNQLKAEIINSDINVQMENVAGCHGVIGLEKVVKDKWVLFLDYRYTKLETTAVVSGGGMSEVVDGTYDHAIVRAGVNLLF